MLLQLYWMVARIKTMTSKRGLAPLWKVKPAAQNLRIKHLVLLLMMKTFIYSLIKAHFRVFYQSFFGIFYSIFGIFSIPFMAFIFMSVSECILNIRMLAQDDLNSFLKNARRTFKFLEKNDTFIIVIEYLRCKFNEH